MSTGLHKDQVEHRRDQPTCLFKARARVTHRYWISNSSWLVPQRLITFDHQANHDLSTFVHLRLRPQPLTLHPDLPTQTSPTPHHQPLSTPPPQSTAARRRLVRDFRRLQADPPAGISGAPKADNIMIWNAVIFGPGGFWSFRLACRVPLD